MKIIETLSHMLPRISEQDRVSTCDEISLSASPGFDFYLLVLLSGSIATLGLLTNSAAVIIGAMLLAPLMSPIIGIGLASVLADQLLLRKSMRGLIGGALLAVALAALITLLNRAMPFISMSELPAEIMNRTRPSPLDLGIALAGGVAAAYALTRPSLSAALPGVAIATALMPPLCTIGAGLALGRLDVALGAGLLFLTNAVAIAFASAVVFLLRGLNPSYVLGHGPLPRSLIISAILTLVLLIPLSFFSIRFITEANQNRLIENVVREQIDMIPSAELSGILITRQQDTVHLVLTVQSNAPVSYEEVVALQKAIVEKVNHPVSVKVNQVLVERLDPLVPPTATPTPTQTRTSTPGPSPTITPSPSPTFTPTSSPTSTPLPSATPTYTPEPFLAVLQSGTLPALRLYQEPGGPVIGTLYPRQQVTVINNRQVFGGIEWVQVEDTEGRIGWIPSTYILELPSQTTAPDSLTPTVTP